MENSSFLELEIGMDLHYKAKIKNKYKPYYNHFRAALYLKGCGHGRG